MDNIKRKAYKIEWGRSEKGKKQKVKYYKKNIKKIKGWHKKYYEKNKKMIRKRNNEYYIKHKEHLNTITTNRRISRRTEILNYKGGKCKKCGYNKCIQVLELHHKIPKNKEFTINNVLTSKNYNFNKIKKELNKCDILCSICHREIHYIWRIKRK